VDNELLFTGRRIDPVAGLQLNRHRFYHQQLGRWVSRDPIEYKDSLNLCEYVSGIPTSFTDPSGLALFGGCTPGSTREQTITRPSPTIPGLEQTCTVTQKCVAGYFRNGWVDQGQPRCSDQDENGNVCVTCTAGAFCAGYRAPADPFLLVLGDLPDLNAGEGPPAFPGSVLGPPGRIIGSAKAPRIPFTYGLPPRGYINDGNCGLLLDSMRKAAELLLRSGRLNEYQTQMDAIRKLEAICDSQGFPTSASE
jgi:RHS repeat-associated protein